MAAGGMDKWDSGGGWVFNSYIFPSRPIITYITSKIWCSLDLLVGVLVSYFWFPLHFMVFVKLLFFGKGVFLTKGRVFM